MNREVADRVIALRAERDLMWKLQVAMLILFCQLDRAADEAEREERLTAESTQLLREARRWLGPGARETS